MTGNGSLSVILPAFNEAGTLEDVVRRVDGVISASNRDGEIIIVNDGSVDDTGAIANWLQSQLPRVRAIHHERNAGYGAAQRTGIKAASAELVCVFPADGQIPPEELHKYLAAVDGADVVAGMYPSRPDRLARRVLSRIYVLVLRILFGVRLRNVNAPKLYRREQIQAVDITAHGGFADAQIVIQLYQQGRRFREIPVQCVRRLAGSSSVGTAAALQAIRELCGFYRTSRSR